MKNLDEIKQMMAAGDTASPTGERIVAQKETQRRRIPACDALAKGVLLITVVMTAPVALAAAKDDRGIVFLKIFGYMIAGSIASAMVKRRSARWGKGEDSSAPEQSREETAIEPEQSSEEAVMENFAANGAAKCAFCDCTVSDDDRLEIPFVNSDASGNGDGQIRSECIVHPYCCAGCREEVESGKIGLERIESIPGIAFRLRNGARIKEEWSRRHARVVARRNRRIALIVLVILAAFCLLVWLVGKKNGVSV